VPVTQNGEQVDAVIAETLDTSEPGHKSTVPDKIG
jgi:hypothetical protein